MATLAEIAEIARQQHASHSTHHPATRKASKTSVNSPSNNLGLHGILENDQSTSYPASLPDGREVKSRDTVPASKPPMTSAPNTPRVRTANMPRSSFVQSQPQSPYSSYSSSRQRKADRTSTIDPFGHDFVRTDSGFRGAWSYDDPEQNKDRKGKRRESWASSPTASTPVAAGSGSEEAGLWKRWVEIPLGLSEPDGQERTASPEPNGTPRTAPAHIPDDQAPPAADIAPQNSDGPDENRTPVSPSAWQPGAWSDPLKLFGIARSRSLPHMTDESPGKPTKQRSQDTADSGGSRPNTAVGGNKWAILRNRLRTNSLVPQRDSIVKSSQAAEVDLNDELLAGGLGVLLLRMHFDRDENGRRRVPVLLHHLKIRVSDSVHPLHGAHAVFRIECEYAAGAARWVIYRELRDFISLHTHYRLSNSYRWESIDIPEFPRTSLPYFNLLKREGREKGTEMGKAEFARIQRESLENYLIGLIKAMMFRPEANRLCRWFEISALSVALAQRGGVQGKAGLLRVMSGNSSRKGTHSSLVAWARGHEPKWWIVRESYLVAVEEPAELQIFDVFLLDNDFAIERPKRYYRQGLDLLHHRQSGGSEGDNIPENERDDVWNHRNREARHLHPNNSGRLLHPDDATDITIASQSTMSRFLSMGRKSLSRSRRRSGSRSEAHHSVPSTASMNGDAQSPSQDHAGENEAGQSSESEDEQQRPTIDPSIGQDPRKVGGAPDGKSKVKDVSSHTFYIRNSQRRLKLVAKNERQMLQFIASMERMAAQSHWNGKNRFESFAPIRLNVSAQWLVDGRDYFWNLSRAILMAKERIYIHDWWLSPELYLRRPGKEGFRLDRLLKRKAEEGVKIFVILYKEVSSRTTPTDSNYAKQRLMSLHRNIMVQRSPSHFATGTFFWAHHEKLCVIDETIAFMGGLDACFGRWDTPQHVLVDDGEPHGPEGSEQIWIGKDYSNSRVMDFHTLNKPEQDMYDRTKVARMPWHDVGMQVVGQPARDLCRHFVERWNHLLRVKSHSREMPFLLPPPDFKINELTEQGLTGTCEVQICRSAGPWSMGTIDKTEHSIQNAYLKAIQMSEHFVYIENQFFITSTTINEVVIENNIGDALVHRIIRAHREGQPWKACILIPLLPGFTFPIDHTDASAIRLIMEYQNRTICRGPNSIFARLRKEGIDPDEYITFFSLRGWAKLQGDVLTTEQVYIHAKIMIVDDRLVIIGSANINERSQRGDRDSELAAVVRDTDMIDSFMGGKPFKVGRFAHTLRVRLMREHVGVDVDGLTEEDEIDISSDPPKPTQDENVWDPDSEQVHGDSGVTGVKHRGAKFEAAVSVGVGGRDAVEQAAYAADAGTATFITDIAHAIGLNPKNNSKPENEVSIKHDREMYGADGTKQPGFADSKVPTLEEKTVAEHRPTAPAERGESPLGDAVQDGTASTPPKEARVQDGSGQLFGAPAQASTSPQTDDRPPNSRPGHEDANAEEKAAVGARQDLRKHLGAKLGTKAWTVPTPAPKIDANGFGDPISDAFFKDVWMTAAVHNTEIYRKVFHCTPDDLVTTWKQYKEFIAHQERLLRQPRTPQQAPPVARVPSEERTAEGNKYVAGAQTTSPIEDRETTHFPNSGNGATETAGDPGREKSPTPDQDAPRRTMEKERDNRTRRATHANEPFEQWERDEMEALCNQVQGHLVLFPTRFLEGEDSANNFLFNADRLLPMPIYD